MTLYSIDTNLIIIIASAILIGVIGFLPYRSDPSKLVNRMFMLFALSSIAYAFGVYFVQISSPGLALIILRSTIFSATWYAYSFFQFFYFLFSGEQKIPYWHNRFVLPVTILVSFISLTPLVFTGIEKVSSDSPVLASQTGPGIILFGLLAMTFLIAGLVFLVKKFRVAKGKGEKSQVSLILLGTIITYSLIGLFNVIFPIVFDNLHFVNYVSIFTLPFIILTGYSIIRFGFLNAKVIITEAIVYILWIIVLVRALLFRDHTDLIIGIALFLIIVPAGMILVKSVRREIRQKDELGILSKELFKANEKLQEIDQMKTEFLSLASHQLRTPLTAIKGYSSMILEGSFGAITKKVSEPIERIFKSSVTLAEVIGDLLDVSKIEQGGMQYSMRTFSLTPLLQSVVDEQKLAAKEKNLILSFHADPGHKYAVKGDKLKLRQIFQNLIDNAIKYTPKGSVTVSLGYTKDRHVRIEVKDTGLGISAAGMDIMFQKFSRGAASKVNTGGSGLGLYLAMQIVKAHAGKVWAESEGEGKGATFIVELPTLYN